MKPLTHSPHELEERFDPTDAVYATPSSPEATVRKLDNPVYRDDEYDVNVCDFKNPVYRDAADDSAQQDELYTTPQAPQAMSLGMGEDGPEYDYATNPGQGAVTVQVKTNSATPAAHEYTVMDESRRKRMEVNEMKPYEQLHHRTDPPDFVRLAEIEGAGYGSLH